MFNKFLKLPTEQKALLVAAVVVIILGLFYHSYNYPQVYARMGAGVGRLRGSVNLEAMSQKCSVVLIYSKTCPFCKDIVEKWDDLKNYSNGKFTFNKIESAELNNGEYMGNKIIAFPTILVFNGTNKKGKQYTGERNIKDIALFVSEECNINSKNPNK